MNITQRRYEILADAYLEMYEKAEGVAHLWLKETGRGRESIERLELYPDTIYIYTEEHHCSCCSGDRNSHRIPASYMWNNDWIEEAKAKREEEKRLEKERQEQAKREREAAAEKKRKEQYLKLKEEFESA